jgi:chloride channel protein, CIC family
MLGGAIGGAAHHIFPAYVATPGAYALVGMGTAFAGVIRAPMTSVVMIFEITRDYAVIVPLMISNLVSYFIASRIQKDPIYEVLADQDGIHLPLGRGQGSARRQVLQVMHPPGEPLDAEASLEETLKKIGQETQRAWLVCDPSGVIGVLTIERLHKAIEEPEPKKQLADLFDGREFPHLHSDHSLDLALDRMGASHLDLLPVVSRANLHQLLGVVRLRDVLKSYGVDKVEEGDS